MILQKLKAAEMFTPGENLIAEYILNHIQELRSLTASQLAEKSYSSQATVLRLCKKTGAKNYQDFRQQILIEAVEETKINSLLEHEPISESSDYEDILNTLPDIYKNAISKTRLGLDKNVIQRVVNRMRHAELIELYGMGISYTIAKAAAFKLMTVGIPCNSYHGINEHFIVANKKRRNKVAIVISLTGRNSGMLYAAKVLRNNGAYVIALGGNETTELKQLGNEFIQIYTRNLIMSMEVITSITSVNYILDIIFAMLMVDNYQKNVEAATEVWKQRN